MQLNYSILIKEFSKLHLFVNLSQKKEIMEKIEEINYFKINTFIKRSEK